MNIQNKRSNIPGTLFILFIFVISDTFCLLPNVIFHYKEIGYKNLQVINFIICFYNLSEKQLPIGEIVGHLQINTAGRILAHAQVLPV